jgi:N-methylhydantoinase A
VRPLADVDPAALDEAYADLAAAGRDDLESAGVDPADRAFDRAADLRYEGQSHSLTVPVPDGLDAAVLSTVADRFHAAHERRYGHADPAAGVEVVTLRVTARGRVEPPDLAPPDPGGTVADARRETRRIGLDDGWHDAPVFDRSALPFGGAFDGPAVVEGAGSTCVVRPGQRARVADDGTLAVEVAP